MAADTHERAVVGLVVGSVFGTFVGSFLVTRNRLNNRVDVSKPYTKAEQLVVGACSLVSGILVSCGAVIVGES